MTDPRPSPSQTELTRDGVLITLASSGYEDQGWQWAGHKYGYVHLFERADGQVLRLKGNRAEVWREKGE